MVPVFYPVEAFGEAGRAALSERYGTQPGSWLEVLGPYGPRATVRHLWLSDLVASNEGAEMPVPSDLDADGRCRCGCGLGTPLMPPKYARALPVIRMLDDGPRPFTEAMYGFLRSRIDRR